MRITRISNLIILSLGLLAGFALSGTFKGCRFKKQATVQLTPDPITLRAQVKAGQRTMQRRLDSFRNANTVLQQQVTAANERLNTARRQSRQLQQQYQHMQDNTTGVMDCDSLQSLTAAIVGSDIEKDSLCDAVITGLQLQADSKDSTIAMQTEQYRLLQYSFDQCSSQSQQLYTYYRRQQKRQKVQSRLLSVGVALLSGFAAFELLHH